MTYWSEIRRERGARITAAGAIAVGLLWLALAPAALASTGDIIAPQHPPLYTAGDGWQAGTCIKDNPTCSVATPEQFFEQAAGHPPDGFTQFIVKTKAPGETPVGELQTVRVDLPVGLSVNPGAAKRCALETFEAGASGCPMESQVGESAVTASAPPLGLAIPPIPGVTQVPVYNITPPPGEPARFGLELLGKEIFLKADVASGGDYHEGFTIAVPKALELPGLEGLILKDRLVFDGTAGDGTFITTPSTCLGPASPGPSGSRYSTFLLAASYAEEASPGYQFPQSAEPRFESPIPPGTSPKECGSIPYQPSIAVDPRTAEADSPAGAAVTIEVPHIAGATKQDSSDTETAAVGLPVGMGINPSAANGLQTCSEAQFAKNSTAPAACPPASKVGTAEIKTPPLPEGSLTGDVYVAQQGSRDPASGDEYRIFVDAASSRYGVSVKLIGRVAADPRTGQLTTTFAENPQVPFSSVAIGFDGGARAVLSSPPVCASQAAARMSPWSGNPPATPTGPVSVSKAPGGGACAATMAARPFAPGFAAAPKSARAGAFSPFSIHMTRADGQQELKGVDVTLPPGMTGKLAGIPYCTAADLATAAASAGAAEAAASSCPAKSLVGTAAITAGTGPAPLRIGGKVFLSGPYHGAPLSLAVVTPATAGPFDLGTVVVRVALFVDPDTAQIRALSDPVPDVYGGAKLDVRTVDIDIDRPSFTLNPTSCGPLATAGVLNGGGANPLDPAAFSSFPVSAPFQTTDCGALGFRPKLTTRLFGGRKSTKRAQHPKFRAVLTAREGDANIGRAAVTLPHSEFLDQAHIRTICTRVQLAASNCPAGAIYGYASAQTPLLDDELSGPVYLVSSDHPLPDLLADLHGQVDVHLHGAISSAKGRIKSVFYPVPDVPVGKFVLTMKGGKRGLLVNSRDLCAKPSFSSLNFKAQNGKQLRKKRLPLRVPACRRHGGRHRPGR
jgi:hypothetical protein